ncbi:DUF1493 family protein [Burkholderia ubonensis]|uniref:DUF1493 family protein n=1 Tax=Burkholderia ubonensis TaxID=101571 RepID=UPI00075A18A3|nr:DUF1493 family protein [Burkholderia ubonensis]AOI71570.1 hypothetical protein WI31_19635 [Burkholderia ubonensis]KUZ14547.1 hypothetical protein WI29_22545 [Burkholderia ubonensis]KUZ19137.1 hypothetical protein WI30_02220 [Burkholderia ubonensis]KUZ40375.1 hypothetical protein WI32_00345 [Burkholderia ubonensis]KUZ42351.1 hypothetical protein WI33_30155 [Burkholderia ubonensis]
MVDIESSVIEFVRKKSGFSVLSRAADITENSDLDADLDFDAAEVEEMMLEYSAEFNVDVSQFDIKKYYPEDDFSFLDLINPFKKKVVHRVPDLNVRMLITSAKAGRWLYG